MKDEEQQLVSTSKGSPKKGTSLRRRLFQKKKTSSTPHGGGKQKLRLNPFARHPHKPTKKDGKSHSAVPNVLSDLTLTKSRTWNWQGDRVQVQCRQEEEDDQPTSPMSMVNPTEEDHKAVVDDDISMEAREEPSSSTLTTSIFLERMICCGSTGDVVNHTIPMPLEVEESTTATNTHRTIPEDPTVQESIECIFASQLQEGLNIWDDECNDSVKKNSETLAESLRSDNDLLSPAGLHQSKKQHRSNLTFAVPALGHHPQTQHGSLTHIGTVNDPSLVDSGTVPNNHPTSCVTPTVNTDPLEDLVVPPPAPKDWPQAPLLLRPTPGSGTRIKGVRFTQSSDYLWSPSHTSTFPTWVEALQAHWAGKGESFAVNNGEGTSCDNSTIMLPINNGNEELGHSLVTDFETALFEGTLLLRLRHTNGTTQAPYDDKQGYFSGVNRRYQASIRGRFKQSLPWMELHTGVQLSHTAGKLPPKWMIKGALKVLSFFAPQLDAKLDGNKPYSLTPLGSTPPSIAVDPTDAPEKQKKKDWLLDGLREEPKDPHRTLLGATNGASSTITRSRGRKKAFDKLLVEGSASSFKTDPSQIYTFEFLQHLFNFQEFSLDLGSMLGSVELQDVLNGQPLQIMAKQHGGNSSTNAAPSCLWSFDLWHEGSYGRAKELEGTTAAEVLSLSQSPKKKKKKKH